LTAASKSFDIEHPSKPGFRLRYGVLEGPEHGVYFRGFTETSVIELPYYWVDLVHEKSITVQLTPLKNVNHWVEKIENNQIFVKSSDGNVKAYFFIQAERKDVDKVLLEYKPTKE
jgi:hypothetical protein